MDYHTYATIDFILDDYFFNWVIQADKSSDTFWKTWLEQHPYKKREVEEACKWIFILYTEFNKAEIEKMPQKEQLWKRIVEAAKNDVKSQNFQQTDKIFNKKT